MCCRCDEKCSADYGIYRDEDGDPRLLVCMCQKCVSLLFGRAIERREKKMLKAFLTPVGP